MLFSWPSLSVWCLSLALLCERKGSEPEDANRRWLTWPLPYAVQTEDPGLCGQRRGRGWRCLTPV